MIYEKCSDFLLVCTASALFLPELCNKGFCRVKGSNAEGCYECSAVFQTVEVRGEYKFMQSICNVHAVFVLKRGCACAKAVKKQFIVFIMDGHSCSSNIIKSSVFYGNSIFYWVKLCLT